MKKNVLLVMLLLLSSAGIYFAHAYTGATVKNPVSFAVSDNENSLITLVPVIVPDAGQSVEGMVSTRANKLLSTGNEGKEKTLPVSIEQVLTIEQGGQKTVLTATNNMGIYLHRCRLECAVSKLVFEPSSFALDPGESQEIVIHIPGDFPKDNYQFDVFLSAEFEGGRARVKAILPVDITEIEQ